MIDTLLKYAVIGIPILGAGFILYGKYRNSIEHNYYARIEQLRTLTSLAQAGNSGYVGDLINSKEYQAREKYLVKRLRKKQKEEFFKFQTELNQVLSQYAAPSS